MPSWAVFRLCYPNCAPGTKRFILVQVIGSVHPCLSLLSTWSSPNHRLPNQLDSWVCLCSLLTLNKHHYHQRDQTNHTETAIFLPFSDLAWLPVLPYQPRQLNSLIKGKQNTQSYFCGFTVTEVAVQLMEDNPSNFKWAAAQSMPSNCVTKLLPVQPFHLLATSLPQLTTSGLFPAQHALGWGLK